MAKEEVTRLQFDVDDSTLKKIDALKEKFGCQSRARVVRKALRLLIWYGERLIDGKELALFDPKTDQTTKVIFLDL